MAPLDGRLPHWPSNKHHHNGSDICPCGGNGLIGKTYRIVATFRRGRPTRAVKKGFISFIDLAAKHINKRTQQFYSTFKCYWSHTTVHSPPAAPLIHPLIRHIHIFLVGCCMKNNPSAAIKGHGVFFVIPCIAPNDGTTFPNALYPGCVSSISPPLPLKGCCMESFNGGHLRSRSHVCLFFLCCFFCHHKQGNAPCCHQTRWHAPCIDPWGDSADSRGVICGKTT